jgi:hypothetical protein
MRACERHRQPLWVMRPSQLRPDAFDCRSHRVAMSSITQQFYQILFGQPRSVQRGTADRWPSTGIDNFAMRFS